MRRSDAARGDGGFTLVEVVLTVSIMGVIGAAVTASMIIGLRTTDATINRLTNSSDVQLAAGYFATDVQGADAVHWADSEGPSCLEPGPALVDLVSEADEGTTAVSYVHEPATADQPATLQRLSCTVGEDRTELVLAEDVTEAVLICPDDSGGCPPAQVRVKISTTGCSALANCREGVDRPDDPITYELVGTRRAP